MTPKTRATVLKALGRAHDAVLDDLYRNRLTRFAKWESPFAPNPERVRLARELRAIRAALRELAPRTWPSSYSHPDFALSAWNAEGR